MAQGGNNTYTQSKKSMGSHTKKTSQHPQTHHSHQNITMGALIRSALTYALQTHEITMRDKQNIDSSTFACVRRILNKFRYKETHAPQRMETYIQLRQPTTASWINKLRIKHMMRQTRDGWSIQNTQQHYANETLKCGKRNGTHDAQLLEIIKRNNTYKAEQGQETIRQYLNGYLYGHEHQYKTIKEIVKIRGKHSQEPDPAHLSPLGRETASRIMLHLHQTKKDIYDPANPEYQCATCQKMFSTHRGRMMHQKHKPTANNNPPAGYSLRLYAPTATSAKYSRSNRNSIDISTYTVIQDTQCVDSTH